NKSGPDGYAGAVSYADRPSCRRPDRSRRLSQARRAHDHRVRGRRDHGAGDHVCSSFRFIALETYTPRGYIAAMQPDAKTSVRKRLQRIEGQVRGLSRMVDEDRYCIDVITQVAAVRAALRGVEEEILRDHVGHCVEHAIASGNQSEQRKKVAELMDVLSRTSRGGRWRARRRGHESPNHESRR